MIREGTAFQSFRSKLWFVRAVGEIITKQSHEKGSWQAGRTESV